MQPILQCRSHRRREASDDDALPEDLRCFWRLAYVTDERIRSIDATVSIAILGLRSGTLRQSATVSIGYVRLLIDLEGSVFCLLAIGSALSPDYSYAISQQDNLDHEREKIEMSRTYEPSPAETAKYVERRNRSTH